MSFDKLNDIVLLEIFDKMDFVDLMNVADLGERFRQLIIQHHMLPKFEIHKKSIELMTSTLSAPTEVETSTENRIVFRGIENFIQTLRNFGHLISKLEFNGFRLNASAAGLIGRSMNEYCRDSLIEIICVNFEVDVMNEWKKPFENVERVTFDTGRMDTHASSQLNRIFPKVRHMKFFKLWTHAKPSAGQHFSFLEHFEFFEYYANSIDIKQFITLNYQLKSLYLWNALETEFPKLFNETLTALEELGLILAEADQFRDSEAIYLSNVRRLKIKSQCFDREAKYFPFILPKLEEFKLTLFEDIVVWIEIIKEMKSLKKLEIINGAFSTEQWITIIDTLTNLVEITVNFDQLSPKSVIESMENHKNLQIVTFTYMKAVDHQYVCENINPNWKIIDNYSTSKHDTVIGRIRNDGKSQN